MIKFHCNMEQSNVSYNNLKKSDFEFSVLIIVTDFLILKDG